VSKIYLHKDFLVRISRQTCEFTHDMNSIHSFHPDILQKEKR